MRILVVDDSGYMRTFLRMHLAQAGHEALEGAPESLFHVLQTLRGARPDLLLTDYEMPAFTGEDLIRSVREDPFLKTMPILVISAHREAELVERLSRWDLCAYLLKPITPESLLQAVERAKGLLGEAAAPDA